MFIFENRMFLGYVLQHADKHHGVYSSYIVNAYFVKYITFLKGESHEFKTFFSALTNKLKKIHTHYFYTDSISSQKKMLKAVLFDMDGVIVDTEPLHKKAYFSMFNEVGIDVTASMYNAFTGQSTINICKQLETHFNTKHTPEELVAIKRKHFKEIFATDTDLDLLTGVLDIIKDYHNNGLKLVLASSASMANIDRIFDRFDLNQYFIAKLSGADLKASKPHPEIFMKAAQATGFGPNNCVVIEDSTNGIAAAKAANIFCVGYNSLHSKNQDYSKADVVISHFNEIEFSKLNTYFK